MLTKTLNIKRRGALATCTYFGILAGVLLGSALYSLPASAQGYTARVTDDSFTSIRDTGTRLLPAGETTQRSFELGTFDRVEIPFEFYFFGRRIQYLVPTSKMFLTTNTNFSCTSSSCSSIHTNVINSAGDTANHQGGIYPFWVNTAYNSGTGGVYSQTDGSVGNRVLTIEFSRFAVNRSNASQNAISVQVKLHESSGTIEFDYLSGLRPGSFRTPNPHNVGVGIAASTDFLPGNDLTRYYYMSSISRRTFASSSSTFQRANFGRPLGYAISYTPNLFLPPVDDITTRAFAVVSESLPELLYATGEVTYELAPAIPGFIFEPSTRTFRGTSVVTLPATTLTYSAIDDRGTAATSDDVTLTQTFTLTVLEALPSDGHYIFEVGEPFRVELPPIPDRVALGPYTLTAESGNTIPDWLNFNVDTAVISGTPTDTSAIDSITRRTFQYSTPDSSGTAVTASFHITVNDAVPVAPTAPQEFTFAIGSSSMASGVLDVFEGGNGTLIYALAASSSLPSWLNFTPADRTLSGPVPADTAGDQSSTTTYMYTATDSNGEGDVATASFTIKIIDDGPVAPTVGNLGFTNGVAIAPVPLPEFGYRPATSSPTLTYSLTGLPADLEFEDRSDSANFRMITGTPAAVGDTEVTYMATDGTDAVEVTFTISVVANSMPIAPSVTNFTFTPGQVVDVTLPDFIGGDRPLTYSLTDESGGQVTTLPAGFGLTFDSANRTISGTVPATLGNDSVPADESAPAPTFTYTATEGANGESDMVSFTIRVIDSMPVAPTASQDFTLEVGEAFNTELAPFTGGDGDLVYSLADRFFLGRLQVTLDGSTRVLSTPSAVGVADIGSNVSNIVTYRATDADGDTAEASLVVTYSNTRPEFGSAEIDPITILQNEILPPVQLPLSESGSAPLVYTFDPELPQGLSFSSENGYIFGVPTVAVLAPNNSFTYRVTDFDGQRDEIRFFLTVTEDLRPIAPSPQAFSYTVGQTVSETLTAFTGGNGTLTYSDLTPALPSASGLSFDSGTLMLSGVLPADSNMNDSIPLTEYTYTATDEDGDQTSTTFTIEVVDDVPVAPTSPPAFVFNVGQPIEETVAVFSGGTGTPTYALATTPTKPSWLTFNTTSGALTGTAPPDMPNVNDSVAEATYTVTVTDSDGGDTASTTFTIEVLDAVPIAPTITGHPFQFSANRLIEPIELPVFMTTTDHNPDLTYTMALTSDTTDSITAFADGLFFRPTDRTISGTSTAVSLGDAPVSYTYTATDGTDAVSVTFTIEILANRVPDPPTDMAFEDVDLVFNLEEDVSVTLPPFTGGDPTLIYAIFSASDTNFDTAITNLIGGLTFTPATRVISGDIPPSTIPNEDNDDSEEYVYRATDANGDTAMVTITLKIDDLMPMAPDPAVEQVFTATVGVDFVQNLEEFISGDGTLTYSVDPELPSALLELVLIPEFVPGSDFFGLQGILLDGFVGGTSDPDDFENREYTYTATDADGDTASQTFTLTVIDHVPVAPEPESFTFLSGQDFRIDLPRFTHGIQPSNTFQVVLDDVGDNPALRQGEGSFVVGPITLPVDDANDNTMTYMYSASTTDNDGDAASATFTITITDDKPSFGDRTIDDINARQTIPLERAAPRILPTALPADSDTGVTAATGYSLVPTPPSDPSATTTTLARLGLAFDSDTRALTGAIADTGTYNFTYTATDAAGDTPTDTDGNPNPITFNIVVSENLVPDYNPSDTAVNLEEIESFEIDTPTAVSLDFDTPLSLGDTAAPNMSQTNTPFDIESTAEPSITGVNFVSGMQYQIRGTTPADTAADQNTTHRYSRTVTDFDGEMASHTYVIQLIDFRPVAPENFSSDPAMPTNYDITLNEAISPAITLPKFGFIPANEAERQTLIYSVTGLPDGVSFDSSPTSRLLTGTPTSATGSPFTVTYKAEFGIDEVTVPFTITVTNDPRPQRPPTLEDQVFIPEQDLTGTMTVELPEFIISEGTIASHKLFLSGDATKMDVTDLVGGLMYHQGTRTISGMVNGTSGIDSMVGMYIYSATESSASDSSPETTETPFNITIRDDTPDFGMQTIPPVVAIAGIPLDLPNPLPASTTTTVDTTYNDSIMYSITPALPNNLMLDTNPVSTTFRELSGTVDAALPEAPYTYIATDDDGDTEMLMFNITVEADVRPLPPTNAQDFNIPVGQAVRVTLDPFTEGNPFADGSLTYALLPTPALPLGLSFDTSSRQITGTITDVAGDGSSRNEAGDRIPFGTYTYTATDRDNDTVNANFTLTVVDALPVAPTVPNYAFEAGATIDDVILPVFMTTAAGITGITAPVLTYRLSPADPVGLVFDADANTRTLSGTPTVNRSGINVTYTASDGVDETPANFTIVVITKPTFGNNSIIDFSAAVREDFTKVLPLASNHEASFTYRLSPLTARFRPDTRTLSGAITGTSSDDTGPIVFTYTASNSVTDPDLTLTDTLNFTINVTDALPSFGSAPTPITPIEVIQNSNIAAVTLPAVETAGTGTTTYSIVDPDGNPVSNDPNSNGLVFDNTPGSATFRQLSGVSATVLSAPDNTFTYRARDADRDTTELTFTITVEEDLEPTAPVLARSTFVFTPGQPLTDEDAITLEAGGGGNGDLTYSIRDSDNMPVTDLVGELTFDPVAREISGTIPADMAGNDSIPEDESAPATMYTYIATDEDGDSAMTPFTIRILDPKPVAPMQTVGNETFTLSIPIPEVILPVFTTNVDDIAGIDLSLDYSLALTSDLGTPITGNFPPSLAGLTYEPSSRTISGMPTVATPMDTPINLTYTATDGLDPVSVTFTITVVTDPEPVPPTLENLVFIPLQDLTANPVTLPPFTISDDDDIDLLHSLSDGPNTNDNLMFGLSFDPVSREIRGMVPIDAIDGMSHDFTYAAMELPPNGDGDIGMDDFTITIRDDMPAFAEDAMIPDLTAIEGVTLNLPNPLPASTTTTVDTTYNDSVIYSIAGPTETPDLPLGLSLDANRRLVGTPEPDTAMGVTTYTYTATDADGDTAPLTFNITVEADTDPVPPQAQDFVFVPGQTLNATTGILMPFTMGNAPLTYAIASTTPLPDWLTFNNDRANPQTFLRLTGRVPVDPAEYSVGPTPYTYTATDRDGDSILASFTITIRDDVPAFADDAMISNIMAIAGVDIPVVTLPVVETAGTGTTTYSLTGPDNTLITNDSSGLMFDDSPASSTFRRLSGSIATPMGAMTYTYTATDTDGDTDTLTFSITVAADSSPLAPSQQEFTFVPVQPVNQPLSAFTGGNGTLTYAISTTTPLPDWLTFNKDRANPQTFLRLTGTVPGTAGPDSVDKATYTYTATDENDAEPVSATFTITIRDDMPAFADNAMISDIPAIAGVDIMAVQLPAVADTTAGTGDITYILTPNISMTIPGLSFDAASNSRMLTGAPDAVPAMASNEFTYSARDVDGDTTMRTLTFTITVEANTRPMAPTQSQAFVFIPRQDLAVTPEALLPFTGGNAPLTYTFSSSPALPQGLSINMDRDSEDFLKFTGEITVSDNTINDQPSRTHTYSVTDADMQTASATFTTEIRDDRPMAPDVPNMVFTPSQVLTGGNAVTLPAFTPGTGDLMYSLTEGSNINVGLMFGLTFDPAADSRTLTGTINVTDTRDDNSVLVDGTPPAPTFTYMATDEDGDIAMVMFTVEILDPRPVKPQPPIDDFSLTEDEPTTRVLPPFTTNVPSDSDIPVPAIVYTVTGLPPGVEFGIVAERQLSGTPSVSNDYPVTYTATAGPDVVNTMFTITVTDDPVPKPPTISNFIFTPGEMVNEELEPFTIDGSDRIDFHRLANNDGDVIDNNTFTLIGDLEYNQDTRIISGTVTSTSGVDDVLATTYRYSATDDDPPDGTDGSNGPDTTEITFTITINDEQPIPPIMPQSFSYDVDGERVTQQLAEFTGGTRAPEPNDDLTYALMPTPALPLGLSFTAASRTIEGTITRDNTNNSHPLTTYTYTATDSDEDVAEATFTIIVTDAMPAFATSDRTIAHIPAIVGIDITPVPLPAVETEGTVTTTYSLLNPDGTPITNDSPGLMFDDNPVSPTFRQLSGAPDAPISVPDNTFTYRARDDDGDTAEIEFTITVEANSAPVAPSGPQAFTYAPGEGVSIPLDTFTGGNAPFTYTLDKADDLMSRFDLTYVANSSVISGSITADTSSLDSIPEDVNDAPIEYAYTATDADGQPATSSFTIRVVDALPVPPSMAIPKVTFSRNLPNISAPLPAFTTTVDDNDDVEAPTLNYRLGGTPPTWLNLNERTLTGMPPPEAALTDHTITYIASDGADEAEATFTLTVTADSIPSPPTIEGNPFTFTPGDMVTITLPDFTGGNGMLTYSLTDGTNPVTTVAGMLPYTVTSTSRTISGMVFGDSMDNSVAATTYTYSATDSDPLPAVDGGNGPDTGMTTFSITIVDEMPAFNPNISIPEITGTVGTAITAVPLPTVVTTGTGTNPTYSISPELPDGLMFDPDANPRMISGTPMEGASGPFVFIATDRDGDEARLNFTINIASNINSSPVAPTTVQAFTFEPGDEVEVTLAAFDGGNAPVTYALNASPALPTPLTFNPNTLVISGTLPPDSPGNDSVATETYTYTATDRDQETASTTFSITITDDHLVRPVAPELRNYMFTVDVPLDGVQLPAFTTSATGGMIDYVLDPVSPAGLTFTSSTRMLAGTPMTVTTTPITVTYTATLRDTLETAFVEFNISIVDVPTLEEATASAIPTVGANIALVASQAISSRVELALNGLSSGIDIRTLDGPSLRLNPQQQNGGSGSPVRFGVWYSAASDSISDTRGTVAWSGNTDSTNLGFDVGFDISASASLVVGILQNSSSTSATYGYTNGDNNSTLSVDLDSTAFYVGFGYDWLDAWFANGSADSTLTDSMREAAIPASFSYQTIGLTAAFEVIDSFSIGAKVESLTSDLSLAGLDDINYDGLQTDSSQLRTAFVANYQLKLGEKGNGLLIPKFEFGFRDLSLNSSITNEATAAGGSAMETGFGVDYLQRAWGLTVGLDIRSISVENYSSDSTQYQIRWESGNYGSGLSFQLTPNSVSETLGGIDSLYSGGYNQYQSLLQRQRGGSSAAADDSKGMNFEVGYGIAAGLGTLTPFLKTTNYRGSGSQAEELGIRYQTLHGLELSLSAERNLTPQTVEILGFPLTFMQQESAVTFSTRYSF